MNKNMDYEKKYNEALKWMRELYPGLHGATKEDAEHYFPELREGEDERIRRTLVEYFGPKAQLDFVRGVPIQKIRDWLEKQKEQKQTDLPAGFYYIDLNGNRYYSKEFRYGDMKLKVGEQKPAECIEDSVKFEEGFKAGRESGLRDGQKYVLNNLDSYGLCKPAEWSEEDDAMLTGIIERGSVQVPPFTTALREEQIEWLMNRLKSLRTDSYKNCNSRWKPSEEQMRCFDMVLCDETMDENVHSVLVQLREQLKRLMQL